MKAIAPKLNRGKPLLQRVALILRNCCLCWLFFLGFAASPFAFAQDTVIIAVAANFKSTLEKLVAAYHDSHPDKKKLSISVSSASTGILYNQIVRGAPFDIFMSADEARPIQLEASFKQFPSEVYAIGRLVYWFPAQPSVLSELSPNKTEKYLKTLIFNDNNRKIAMANPKLAPYGSAAYSVLRKFGLQEAVNTKLVTGNNIAQVFQFVYSGAASSGFVALSQIQHQSVSAEQWLELPIEDRYRIRQRMILLNPSESARSVYRFLKSAQSRHIIQNNGYALPEMASQ